MINMKVIRVKTKVATKPVVENAAFWKRVAEQNIELAQQIQSELDIEKRNHAVALAGVQLWQAEAEKYKVEARKASGYESLYHAAKREAEEWEQTSKDLANRLCVQMDATRKAEETAVDLNLELMERECRITALERRVEWLEANPNTNADFVS